MFTAFLLPFVASIDVYTADNHEYGLHTTTSALFGSHKTNPKLTTNYRESVHKWPDDDFVLLDNFFQEDGVSPVGANALVMPVKSFKTYVQPEG